MKSIIKNLLPAAAALLMLASATAPTADNGYKVGDKARDFNLKNIDGKMVSLTKYDKATKGAIVIFTCNHCPFSKAYEGRIVDLNSKYEAKGYPVIAINPNDPKIESEDSYENMQIRAKEKGFNFPYLVDATQEITHTYGATRTPHVYVLQRTGKDFTVKYIGAIDDNKDEPKEVKNKYVETAVNELLAGKPVSNNYTKAIGCGIKWSSK